jgi:hypothetical protein
MLLSDFALALRRLAKRPGLAATIILIMAAGVGVNIDPDSLQAYSILLTPQPTP